MISIKLIKRSVIVGIFLYFILIAVLIFFSYISFSQLIFNILNGLVFAMALATYDILFKEDLVKKVKKVKKHFHKLMR